jgi:hypothetical protein
LSGRAKIGQPISFCCHSILRVLPFVFARYTKSASSDEKDNAHESHSVIHRRLDEQMRQVNLLDKVVEICSGLDATLREEIKALKETVDRNHKAAQPALWMSG